MRISMNLSKWTRPMCVWMSILLKLYIVCCCSWLLVPHAQAQPILTSETTQPGNTHPETRSETPSISRTLQIANTTELPDSVVNEVDISALPPYWARESQLQENALDGEIVNGDDTGLGIPYNFMVAPTTEFGERTIVLVGLNVFKIEEINIPDKQMQINVWLRLQWNDPRLAWNSSQEEYYGVRQTTYNADTNPEISEIWVPDLELVNQVESVTESFAPKQAIVYEDGTVFWSRVGSINALCAFSGLIAHPFDDNNECSVDFMGWSRSGLYVDYHLMDPPIDFSGTRTAASTYQEYELRPEDFRASVEYYYYPCCPNEPWPTITYTFTFARITTWLYLRMLAFPVMLLTYLSLLPMWWDVRCGERLGFGMTVLLAITAVEIIASEFLPKCPEWLWIEAFTSGSYYFSVLALVESSYATYLFYKEGRDDDDDDFEDNVKDRVGQRKKNDDLVLEGSDELTVNEKDNKNYGANNSKPDDELRDAASSPAPSSGPIPEWKYDSSKQQDIARRRNRSSPTPPLNEQQGSVTQSSPYFSTPEEDQSSGGDDARCTDFMFLRQVGKAGAGLLSLSPTDHGRGNAFVSNPNAYDLAMNAPGPGDEEEPVLATNEPPSTHPRPIIKTKESLQKSKDPTDSGSNRAVSFRDTEVSSDSSKNDGNSSSLAHEASQNPSPAPRSRRQSQEKKASFKSTVVSTLTLPSFVLSKTAKKGKKALYKWAKDRNLNPENFDTVKKVDAAFFRLFLFSYTAFLALMFITVPFWVDDYQVIHGE